MSQVGTLFGKVFIPLKVGNFSEQFVPRTTFGECFCFGSCPCGALSRKYLVHQTNKHPLQKLRAILWGSFPPIKTWSTPRKNIPDGQVKVSPTFFLNIFNFFRAAILQTSCKKLFWSLDVFLVFNREYFMSSLSEPASNRNSEERLF